jgi:hypothetical protein
MNEISRDNKDNAKNGYRNHAEPVASPQPPNLLYFGKKLFPKCGPFTQTDCYSKWIGKNHRMYSRPRLGSVTQHSRILA